MGADEGVGGVAKEPRIDEVHGGGESRHQRFGERGKGVVTIDFEPLQGIGEPGCQKTVQGPRFARQDGVAHPALKFGQVLHRLAP